MIIAEPSHSQPGSSSSTKVQARVPESPIARSQRGDETGRSEFLDAVAGLQDAHRPASGGTSGRPPAATRTAAAGPTACCSGPATPRRSTTPADARRSASSCPMPSISTAPPSRPSTRCSAPTRHAPAPTSARSLRRGALAIARCGARGALALAVGRRQTGDGSSPNPDPRIPIPESRSPIRLTRQEERAGLLGDTATIGTRSGWADRLRERGYALRGHRLVRASSG
jgi:hypothetical protein